MIEPRFVAPDNWSWAFIEPRAGQSIRYGWAVPASPRALVIIYPGLSEYGEKYFEVAHDLLNRNFAVAVIDWRGQGLSWRDPRAPNKRLHDSVALDVADAASMHAHLDTHAPLQGLPRILLAHSMGGQIALQSLRHMQAGTFKAAILSSPLCGLPVPQTLGQPAARSLSALFCKFGLGQHYVPGYGPWSEQVFRKILEERLTSDPARRDIQVHWMQSQPALRMGGITFSWIKALSASMAETQSSQFLRYIQTPVLLLMAGAESIVSNTATARVAGRLPHAETVTIAHALHELMMERDAYRNQFWHHVDRYIAKHL